MKTLALKSLLIAGGALAVLAAIAIIGVPIAYLMTEGFTTLG